MTANGRARRGGRLVRLFLYLLCSGLPTMAQSAEKSPDRSQLVEMLITHWALESSLNVTFPAMADQRELIDLAARVQPATLEDRYGWYMAMMNSAGPFARVRAVRPEESLPEIRWGTVRIEATNSEVLRAVANVDRRRTDLIGKAGTLDAIDSGLAAAILAAEEAVNRSMTPTVARALVECIATREAGTVKAGIRSEVNGLELAMNQSVAGTRAAFAARIALALDRARTTQLDGSRKVVRDLLFAALADDPQAVNSLAEATRALSRGLPDELLKSRKAALASIRNEREKLLRAPKVDFDNMPGQNP